MVTIDLLHESLCHTSRSEGMAEWDKMAIFSEQINNDQDTVEFTRRWEALDEIH